MGKCQRPFQSNMLSSLSVCLCMEHILDDCWLFWAPLVAQIVKDLPAVRETQVRSLDQEDPLEKGMATTPAFLPEEFHGQRSRVGYSPWGHKQLGTTDCLKQVTTGTSLAIQGLRLCLHCWGHRARSLARELRDHVPQAWPKIKQTPAFWIYSILQVKCKITIA